MEIDPDAWVDEYGDALFGFVLARVKDKATAEDLVQETFLAAMRGLERFKGHSSVKTWLFGILKHKLIDHYRKNKSTFYAQDMVHDPDNLEAFFNTRGSWQIRPENWSVCPPMNPGMTNPGQHSHQKPGNALKRNSTLFPIFSNR